MTLHILVYCSVMPPPHPATCASKVHADLIPEQGPPPILTGQPVTTAPASSQESPQTQLDLFKKLVASLDCGNVLKRHIVM